MKTNNEASGHLELSRENVLADIINIVSEHMDIPPDKIGKDDHLINDVGCDSLDVTEIAMEVEEHFDINIPDDLAQDANTPGQIADGVLTLLGDSSNNY